MCCTKRGCMMKIMFAFLLSLWLSAAQASSTTAIYSGVYMGGLKATNILSLSAVQLDTFISDVRTRQTPLIIQVSADDVTSNQLWSLLNKFQDAGIQVKPWLLIKGDYANSGNYTKFIKNTFLFTDAWQKHQLLPTTFVVDMEPSLAVSAKLQDLLNQSKFIDAVTFLRGQINPAQFEKATNAYRNMIDELHDRGWKVDVTTVPMLLDGGKAVAQAFHCIIDGVAWDKITFQVYRSIYADNFSNNDFLKHFGSFTNYLIYSYGKTAFSRYGKRAGLDLGVIGAKNYSSEALTEDVDAAWYAY